MQFIHEFAADESIIVKINSILKANQQEFEPSQVYNSVNDIKLVKPELRLSEFRTIIDKELFKLASDILNTATNITTNTTTNTTTRSPKFVIFENDIMHIKYKPGGYFKEHEDYLSITSNFIEEYSLLICVNGTNNINGGDIEGSRGDDIGGRTLLKINDKFTYKSSASCTQNMCLLFRKDIQHEGELLKAGIKEILTFNVWKINPEVSQILQVSFPEDGTLVNKIINIDVNAILNHPSGDLLKKFLSSQVGGPKNTTIVEYKSQETYEEFSIIADIYAGNVLSYHDIEAKSNIIDYYLFDRNHLLIKHVSNIVPEGIKQNFVVTDDFIVFGNQLDYLAYLDYTKTNMLPFIPFKIIYAEGSLSYGGGMSGDDPTMIKMTPVFASFSENNNIMFIQNIMGRDLELGDPYNYCDVDYAKYSELLISGHDKVFENMKDGELFQQHTDNEFGHEEFPNIKNLILDMDDSYRFEGKISYFNLEAKIDTETTKKFISNPNCIYKNNKHYHEACANENVFALQLITARDSLHVFAKSTSIDNPKLICDKVNEIKLYDEIKNQLNNIMIPNAQRAKSSQSEDYCNENVYGNFNLITVYGFLKL